MPHRGTCYSEYRLKIRQPLVPPNPKLFESAYSIGHCARMIRHIIQIAGRVGTLMIDGRRRHLIANRHHGDAGFQAAGAAQQVPGHRLGGTDRHFVGVVAEGPLDRHGFGFVADVGGRAMRVDVIDLVGTQRRRRFIALRITRNAPSPSSGGAVTWKASALIP